MIPIILTVGVLTIFYYLLHLNYQYWSKRGIPGPKPHFLLGNTGKTLVFKASPGQVFTDIYNKYKNDDIVGLYRATTPVLLIRDPELIKEVTSKAFINFHDNDFEFDKNVDPILGRNPFLLKGEEWKIVRQKLTPGFTSGKLKLMYPLLEEVCKNLVKYIDRRPEMSSGKGYDVKNVCARYTLNNVASCAFGIEGKCLEEENSQFRQLALEFFAPGTAAFFGFFLNTMFPPLSKVLKLRGVSKEVERKLTDLVMQTVKYREDNNVERNDFLNILIKLRKTSTDYKFDDIDIVAHSATFFADGYETSATMMTFVLFELASNPETQKKLRDEVTKAFENNGNKLPYEVLQELQYLEAVIYETIRLHPALMHLQKICTKEFTFTPKNTNKPITIEKGTPVILPAFGLHRDSKYYEDPDTFKPARFLPENKDKIVKFAFLGFGEGPRTCIGQRFGLLQLKIGLAHVIHNYEMTVNEKTQVPIKYETTNPITSPAGGIWLNFKKIK